MKRLILLLLLFTTSFIFSQNIGINQDGSIKLYNELPSTFTNSDGFTTLNYPKASSLTHYEDGWRDYIRPTINNSTQRLGNVIFDVANDIFTNEVISLTDEQIQASLIAQSESLKQQLIQEAINAQIEAEAQVSDDAESLDSQALFPLWNGNGVSYALGFKVQHFTAENELVLYKVVQAHTSQVNWQPRDVPALFTRVAYPDQVLAWVQPTGAQDAYQIGDEVTHDNPNDGGNIWLYQSKINANTQEPGRDGTFNRWWEPINVIN